MKLCRNLVFACLLVAPAVTITGCGPKTAVLNLENQPVLKNLQPTYTLDEVRNKIAAGVIARKWGIVDESKGWMIARVDSGGHWAKVRITYDTEKYTIIHFETSPGLKFTGDSIHNRYNGWVKNLNASIQKQFIVQSDEPAPAATPTVNSAVTPPADAATPTVAPSDAPPPDPSWNDGE